MFMKYFVVTDVHGFYSILKEKLQEVGFDLEDPNHFLISCGDLFDRGMQPKECLDFMMSIPKERRVFIKGNHESMLIDAIKRGNVLSSLYDRNGTTITFLKLSGKEDSEDVSGILEGLRNNVQLQRYLSELKDYYELDDYIFCHGWIPKKEGQVDYYKQATEREWEEARWTNGYEAWALSKLFGKKESLNKTIVCGHYRTAFGHAYFHDKGKDIPRYGIDISECCFDIFYDEGIIGLDACTAASHKMNVLVIEK